MILKTLLTVWFQSIYMSISSKFYINTSFTVLPATTMLHNTLHSFPHSWLNLDISYSYMSAYMPVLLNCCILYKISVEKCCLHIDLVKSARLLTWMFPNTLSKLRYKESKILQLDFKINTHSRIFYCCFSLKFANSDRTYHK